jgi:Uma2 family endonuclease
MMILTHPDLTFERFLKECPSDCRYELVNGEMVPMNATRNHDDIADFIADSFKAVVKQHHLNYVVKTNTLIRTVTLDGTEQGRRPDVSVIDKNLWRSDRAAYAALRESIPLAVEVVSTNWDDDYLDKVDEYQRLGISEYWIVDYLALGGREFLGKPKIPTVSVYLLNEVGQYQRTQYRGSDQIISQTFPQLTLTAEQVLNA